ncbi:MAG: site-2 protease family protein [Planctomycetota bacterium]
MTRARRSLPSILGSFFDRRRFLLLTPGVGPEHVHIAGVLVIILFSLGVHEAAHAWTAWRLGDDTAKQLGRISLNPLVHLDFFMSLVLPAMMLVTTGGRWAFGGAKPVPVNIARLRHPTRDYMLVSLAGPVSNVLLGVALTALLWIFMEAGAVHEESMSWGWLAAGIQMNFLLAFFNLIPCPPLDGSRVVAYFLPEAVRWRWMRLDAFGFVILVGLYFLRVIHYLYGKIFYPFYDFYFFHFVPLG